METIIEEEAGGRYISLAQNQEVLGHLQYPTPLNLFLL